MIHNAGHKKMAAIAAISMQTPKGSHNKIDQTVQTLSLLPWLRFCLYILHL